MPWYQMVVGGCQRDGFVARIYKDDKHVWSAEEMPTPRDAIRAVTGDGFMERVHVDMAEEAAARIRKSDTAATKPKEKP